MWITVLRIFLEFLFSHSLEKGLTWKTWKYLTTTQLYSSFFVEFIVWTFFSLLFQYNVQTKKNDDIFVVLWNASQRMRETSQNENNKHQKELNPECACMRWHSFFILFRLTLLAFFCFLANFIQMFSLLFVYYRLRNTGSTDFVMGTFWLCKYTPVPTENTLCVCCNWNTAVCCWWFCLWDGSDCCCCWTKCSANDTIDLHFSSSCIAFGFQLSHSLISIKSVKLATKE